MTRPTRYLLQMVLFLAVIAGLCVFLRPMLVHAFWANPSLNSFILAILALGILWNLLLVLRLWPEMHWLDLLRNPRLGLSSPPPPPLLAPMSVFLTKKRDNSAFILPAQTTVTLLDSLGARIDERRDISRYVTQLLVFLGLLGTFYGLLLTIRAIADVIGDMSVSGDNLIAMFEHVKLGLIKPLNGMATAFSGSMFGLAGSLILGFLDLTSRQAQNRFYNDLEFWLHSFTQLEHDDRGKTLVASRTAHETVPPTPQTDTEMMQNFIRAANENLSLLQENMKILRDIAVASNAGRQNINNLLGKINTTLENLREIRNTPPQTDTQRDPSQKTPDKRRR